uniref:Uncharacterized protein n=1 Tax=Amphimedon queenslandica TaxID=400682 RepID=A0A1X7U7T1_AMPQE
MLNLKEAENGVQIQDLFDQADFEVEFEEDEAPTSVMEIAEFESCKIDHQELGKRFAFVVNPEEVNFDGIHLAAVLHNLSYRKILNDVQVSCAKKFLKNMIVQDSSDNANIGHEFNTPQTQDIQERKRVRLFQSNGQQRAIGTGDDDVFNSSPLQRYLSHPDGEPLVTPQLGYYLQPLLLKQRQSKWNTGATPGWITGAPPGGSTGRPPFTGGGGPSALGTGIRSAGGNHGCGGGGGLASQATGSGEGE